MNRRTSELVINNKLYKEFPRPLTLHGLHVQCTEKGQPSAHKMSDILYQVCPSSIVLCQGKQLSHLSQDWVV